MRDPQERSALAVRGGGPAPVAFHKSHPGAMAQNRWSAGSPSPSDVTAEPKHSPDELGEPSSFEAAE